MAGANSNNYTHPIDDSRQRSNKVYINPYHHDREQIPDGMDPTGQYEYGSNADINSYSTDDHHHHHHGHHSTLLLPLAIRRHPPGSNDPSLQKLPTNLQSSSSDNISLPSKLHITVKRNPIPPDQTIIQPILYPVAVYVNNPVPQYPINQPIQPVQQIQPVQPVQQIQPIQPVQQIQPVQPVQQIQPVQPIKEITKPPSPKKPVSPVKTSSTPPFSPDRYETESFHLPSSRNKTPIIRRPVRTDLITPAPLTPSPQRLRSDKVVIEEFDDYDEYYRAPSIYTVPKKVISYRTVPGMTTRELENTHMDHSGEYIYTKSPQVQTVTYRTS